MDPLTHTATGLFLSRAGLKRWTPQAAPILMLAANAPDIDIVTASRGWLNYLHYHRHLTHSLVALPIMAILPVLLVRAVARRPIRWLGAFLAACVAVASHLLLDLTNVYGIRLFLPFSAKWLRLDWTSLADLWIWGVFLLAILGPPLSRLVSTEISSGKKHSLHYGRASAVFALVFLVLYDGGRAVLHARAAATLDARLYQGQVPTRTLAVPGLNPLNWQGVVETNDFYRVADIDLLTEFNPEKGSIFYKPAPGPAIQAARQTETFQVFMNFDQFPLWRVGPAGSTDGSQRVELFDMRFGTPNQPGFMTSALVNGRGDVVETSFQFGRPVRR